MVKRMLIDATHPEETRAVVVDDRYLVDFDFETSTKLQLKGNVYLAKVTRVEPSLQAAFVEYGGNRHGFLAFSEIHPDYFQVPQADRACSRTSSARPRPSPARSIPMPRTSATCQPAETITTDADEETAEVMADQARRRARLLRSYKIQEVIKRRQIMLVQVVKEERGNKGAALTTYLSLAGRYCVLMPNTPRGGGISRKIVQPDDRRKLKEIAQELEVPQGMGLIIRTAGQERSKAEIKRDYEYLLRLWNEIRETTLKCIAPKMIYEEGDLIKRAMRDLYTRDIEEVLVEGDEGYRSAKRLMTMLMPSRARLVKQYKEETPLFFEYKVEDQLDAMHSPTVQLPAGGSIVIHTTEALTAIDVNSGRSTRERHIDETAVKTNLEAADEVARQLRLRDLAGLIVIDFIDMGEARHQRAVEKRLRDALKADRARIQMGKISQFGLMELSRQRLRASLQELSSQVCPHCAGRRRGPLDGELRAADPARGPGVRHPRRGCLPAGGAAGRGGALRAEPEARGFVPPGAALRHAGHGPGRSGPRAAGDADRGDREARPRARAYRGPGRARRGAGRRGGAGGGRGRGDAAGTGGCPGPRGGSGAASGRGRRGGQCPPSPQASPPQAPSERGRPRRRGDGRGRWHRRWRRAGRGGTARGRGDAGRFGGGAAGAGRSRAGRCRAGARRADASRGDRARAGTGRTGTSGGEAEVEPPVEDMPVAAEAPVLVAEEVAVAVAAEPAPIAEPEAAVAEAAAEAPAAEEAPAPAKPRRVRKPRKTKAMLEAERLAAAEAAAAEAEAATATAEAPAEASDGTESRAASESAPAVPEIEPQGSAAPADHDSASATVANGADHGPGEPSADETSSAADDNAQPATAEDDQDHPQRQGWWSRWVR